MKGPLLGRNYALHELREQRNTDGKKAEEKIVHIICHQENKN